MAAAASRGEEPAANLQDLHDVLPQKEGCSGNNFSLFSLLSKDHSHLKPESTTADQPVDCEVGRTIVQDDPSASHGVVPSNEGAASGNGFGLLSLLETHGLSALANSTGGKENKGNQPGQPVMAKGPGTITEMTSKCSAAVSSTLLNETTLEASQGFAGCNAADKMQTSGMQTSGPAQGPLPNPQLSLACQISRSVNDPITNTAEPRTVDGVQSNQGTGEAFTDSILNAFDVSAMGGWGEFDAGFDVAVDSARDPCAEQTEEPQTGNFPISISGRVAAGELRTGSLPTNQQSSVPSQPSKPKTQEEIDDDFWLEDAMNNEQDDQEAFLAMAPDDPPSIAAPMQQGFKDGQPSAGCMEDKLEKSLLHNQLVSGDNSQNNAPESQPVGFEAHTMGLNTVPTQLRNEIKEKFYEINHGIDRVSTIIPTSSVIAPGKSKGGDLCESQVDQPHHKPPEPAQRINWRETAGTDAQALALLNQLADASDAEGSNGDGREVVDLAFTSDENDTEDNTKPGSDAGVEQELSELDEEPNLARTGRSRTKRPVINAMLRGRMSSEKSHRYGSDDDGEYIPPGAGRPQMQGKQAKRDDKPKRKSSLLRSASRETRSASNLMSEKDVSVRSQPQNPTSLVLELGKGQQSSSLSSDRKAGNQNESTSASSNLLRVFGKGILSSDEEEEEETWKSPISQKPTALEKRVRAKQVSATKSKQMENSNNVMIQGGNIEQNFSSGDEFVECGEESEEDLIHSESDREIAGVPNRFENSEEEEEALLLEKVKQQSLQSWQSREREQRQTFLSDFSSNGTNPSKSRLTGIASYEFDEIDAGIEAGQSAEGGPRDDDHYFDEDGIEDAGESQEWQQLQILDRGAQKAAELGFDLNFDSSSIFTKAQQLGFKTIAEHIRDGTTQVPFGNMLMQKHNVTEDHVNTILQKRWAQPPPPPKKRKRKARTKKRAPRNPRKRKT